MRRHKGLWTGLGLLVYFLLAPGLLFYAIAGFDGFLRGLLLGLPMGLLFLYLFACESQEPDDIPIAS